MYLCAQIKTVKETNFFKKNLKKFTVSKYKSLIIYLNQ